MLLKYWLWPNHVIYKNESGQLRREYNHLLRNHERAVKALEQMVDMFERHIDGKVGPDNAAACWDNARNSINWYKDKKE